MNDLQSVAIIGGGAMGTYVLKALLAKHLPFSIDIYDAAATCGPGMPYREGINADYMLCNAFSREIPPVTQSLIQWLEARPPRELNEWELSAHDLSARAFYPRVLIGEYFESEFIDLQEQSQKSNSNVTVHANCRVLDIVPTSSGTCIQTDTGNGSEEKAYDYVIIATGHVWPDQPEIDGIKLVSPWPYANITNLQPVSIGILGSSLSAIDVVIALGHTFGKFTEHEAHVTWAPNTPSNGLSITMVSHTGTMPEGDFYYPYPYEDLICLTQTRIEQEIACGKDGLLERAFALLIEELKIADADYVDKLGADGTTIEGFAPAYFHHRQQVGGLAATKKNLTEAMKSMRNRETIPHRYALLRAHEVFGEILDHLKQADYDRFSEDLMPVFGDCYAAVPHLSLARIVALYDSGVLNLTAVGEDDAFQKTDNGKIAIGTEDGPLNMDVMIDARGQSAHAITELPFPTLVSKISNPNEPVKDPFRLDLTTSTPSNIYCLALPQILERYPFSQGLANCADLAELVVDDLLEQMT